MRKSYRFQLPDPSKFSGIIRIFRSERLRIRSGRRHLNYDPVFEKNGQAMKPD